MKTLNATLYTYGIAVAAGVFLALMLCVYQQKKLRLKEGTVSWLALLGIPLGILCARLGYCLCRLPWFLSQGIAMFFRFQKGGYMLYGAMLGVFAAAALTAKLTRQKMSVICDMLAAPGALVIAVARLAEGLVGQGFGRSMMFWFDEWDGFNSFGIVDYDFLCRFPFGAQDMYGDWSFAVYTVEAAVALGIFVFLWCKKSKGSGDKTVWLLTLYAAAQVVLESARQDAVIKWGFIRVSQLISAVIILALVILLGRKCGSGKRMAAGLCVMLVCTGIVLMMEFALEQKIGFLRFMNMDVCYFVMIAAACGMAYSVEIVKHKKKNALEK